MLLLVDSFDAGDSTQIGKWTDAPANIVSTTPIHGSYASCPGTQAGSGFGKTVPVADEHATFIAGAYFRSSATLGADSATTYIFGFLSDFAATVHVTIGLAADGSITVRRAGTTLLAQSDPGIVVMNSWHHVEAKVVLNDTTGLAEVYLDGIEVINATGLDTKNAGTKTGFDTVRFERCTAGGSAGHHFDDVFICNGAGTVNNDILGPCRVSVLLPTADSTPEDWALSSGTDSFALVDEATPNGDTDFLFSDVPTDRTQLGMADLTDMDHVVYGVQLGSHARKADSGLGSYRHGIRSDATDANGADHNLTEEYVNYYDIVELDPDGAVPWTPATVNASEAFVEVRS